jgi:uncharacterized LabA/DUF88 family protein
MVREIIPNDDIGVIHYFSARLNSGYPSDQTPARQNVYLRAVGTLPLVEIHLGYFSSNRSRRKLADNQLSHHDIFVPDFRPKWLFTRMWNRKVARRTVPFTVAWVHLQEEKSTDVSLGVHLVRDCILKSCDKAIVVSNDSDFVDAIRLAREAGIPVGIVNPQGSNSTNKMLQKVASFEIPLTSEMLARSQFPKMVLTAKGAQLVRPNKWQ